MTQTRQTLAGLGEWQIVVWYSLAALSTGIFVSGVILLARKYRLGRRTASGRGSRRIVPALRTVAGQSSIRRNDGFAAVAHALTFYGFGVLFVGTVILAVEDDIAKPLGWSFWRGSFYLGYSLFLDLFGAALTVGVLAFAARRLSRPQRLDYRRVDRRDAFFDRRRYVVGDWVLLGVLLFLAVSGFLLEALRIAENSPSFERWSPVGWLLGRALRVAGLEGAAAAHAHLALWWIHGVGALAFVAAVPFTKSLHLLVDPVSLAVADDRVGRALPEVPDSATVPGYARITDLRPAHLLDLDACTKCGICHSVCPATASGLPLSPRDLILDLREHAEGALGARHALGIAPLAASSTDLAEIVPSETVWSCMQCLACVDVCPVGVEQVPIIVELRRTRVDRGDLDDKLQSTLEAIYEFGNSFGAPRRRRARWTEPLETKPKDARTEPVDILWFVGDYASLDQRNQWATRALADVLVLAGVDFGILYDGERNAGNDVRRVGEEILFVDLAEKNIELLAGCEFQRILTTDPHSYNTLKNEYPRFGGSWQVIHHAELLLELLEKGRLPVQQPLGKRVTYHDPCALGRANGVFEPPREVIERLGCELVEMPRNRTNSFCCGAGGGRIWMADSSAGESSRPAVARIEEAAALGGVELFVVACPKDVVMYDDAIKSSGYEGRIRLAELSELAAAAVARRPLPDLVPLS